MIDWLICQRFLSFVCYCKKKELSIIKVQIVYSLLKVAANVCISENTNIVFFYLSNIVDLNFNH
jgi:hypothetical protein